MTKSNDHSGRRRRWLVPVLVLAAVALLTAFVFLQNRGPGDGDSQDGDALDNEPVAPAEVVEPDQPDVSDIETRDPEDLLSAGPVDAPVALVVFSDYQCPFCASWNAETLPEMQSYVESGDLRIEWRDVNIFGEASERAARASYAAALQDRYWDYHDALFPDGEIRTESELSDDGLVELAGDLGLDTSQFAADYSSEEVRSQVQDHANQGIEIGVHSTPAFILGGQPIIGAQPTEIFRQAMDEALAEAG